MKNHNIKVETSEEKIIRMLSEYVEEQNSKKDIHDDGLPTADYGTRCELITDYKTMKYARARKEQRANKILSI